MPSGHGGNDQGALRQCQVGIHVEAMTRGIEAMTRGMEAMTGRMEAIAPRERQEISIK